MKQIFTGIAVSAFLFAACQQGTDTGSASQAAGNKEKALNAAKAFAKRDAAGVLKDCAPDFVDYGSNDAPPMSNLDTIKAGITAFVTAFPDYTGTDFKVFSSESGDTIMVSGNWSGTFTRPYMNIPPTGKSLKYSDVDVFVFNKAGKIISHSSVQSQPAIMAQLGIGAPPAAAPAPPRKK